MGEPSLSPFPQHQVSVSDTTSVSFPVQPLLPFAAPSISFGVPEQLMHKNRLQEYAQRSAISLPLYCTVNEGSQHAPQFRSTVTVDGETYTSPNTFSHRKAAEQDVAKLALENILQKIKDEGCPLINQDTVFCKSILHEFAVKMNLEMPTYNTIQPQGLIPVFTSSLVFNGVMYTGEAGRNKKEAEQLAARAVILSILGNSGSRTILSEIIKSKGKLYAALHRVKSPSSGHINVLPQGISIGQINSVSQGISIDKVSGAISEDRNVEVALAANSASEGVNSGYSLGMPMVHQELNIDQDVEVTVDNSARRGANPGSSSGMPPFHHEFKLPKPEPSSQPINIDLSSEAVNLPIAFVPPMLQQPLGVGPSSGRKRRKNKKKANKKLRLDTQTPIATLPVNQAPSCSVAQ
ncbi:hypothetical protein I3843_15G084300 [Carya illinoinensis]|uniref:DRBM domain-containing protein n=4 Tax=Carya illinoinensis TaxID=32201 RepID=A0A8T1N9M3_CARIL|nr:double-stranded RNA-binding protein 4-like isoform X1 [Carya illinoinensis]KAG2666911.1 hypothetical protein I3760_15G087400 [Carya illinoinensis]KAG6627015.1 hypothetical protein CIPAW_15G093300 [Carya illinoinensis]KAG6627016.1 hypothetical protein CIPAW_15G093300 [Carya illinoinensis]KAG6675203.1 hypothetical protein I3842_15G089800 [Carya illinoinensis]KAG6675205.1 hypothetical protein I3842_15G089800 [Carya illinoinensis]